VPTVLIILFFLHHFTGDFLQTAAGGDGGARRAHRRARKRPPKPLRRRRPKRLKQYKEALKAGARTGLRGAGSRAQKAPVNAPRKLKEARAKASAEVSSAKERIAGDCRGAPGGRGHRIQLSAEIARRILQATAPRPPRERLDDPQSSPSLFCMFSIRFAFRRSRRARPRQKAAAPRRKRPPRFSGGINFAIAPV